MSAPSDQLALLRTIVGPLRADEFLLRALRRTGGDLAAAVNIILDSQPPALPLQPAPPALPPYPEAGGVAILLDDSDDGQPSSPTLRSAASAVQAPPVTRAPLPAPASTPAPVQPPAAKIAPQSSRRTSGTGGRGKPSKRPRLQEQAPREIPVKLESPQSRVAPALQWSFHVGRIEFDAYSTSRVDADQRFEGADGTFGPLLRAGSRLELRWAAGPAKRGRAGGSRGSGGGCSGAWVRFDACGMEVGRFPAPMAHMLVPLLVRQFVDVEARLGQVLPRVLALGTNVPVILEVSLRSAALQHPGRGATDDCKATSSSVSAGVGKPPAVDMNTKGSAARGHTKTAAAVVAAEVDREVVRAATAQLLDQLRGLRRKRCAAAAQEPSSGGDDSSRHPGPPGRSPGFNGDLRSGSSGERRSDGKSEVERDEKEGGEEEEDEDTMDAAVQEDMSCEAGAQLGGREALERTYLPAIALPGALFAANLRHYQAQAVFWMWRQENPVPAKLPPAWLRPSGAEEAGKDTVAECETDLGGNATPSSCGGRNLHPMWHEYELSTPVGPLPGREAPTQFIYHHQTTGALSLDFPDAALAHCRGGILADDMGLGKTVMCLALLSLDQADDVPNARAAAPALHALEVGGNVAVVAGAPGEVPPVVVPPATARRKLGSFFRVPGDAGGAGAGAGASNAVGDGAGASAGTTSSAVTAAGAGIAGSLVVMPLSLIAQWHAEVGRHFPPGQVPLVYEYHGVGRLGVGTERELRAYDIVLVTYGTLSSEKDDGPLFQVYWRRVILDEAHSIKNRCSRTAQAAFRLRAFARWCVTGTPLQNNVDELYSLVRFLKVDPWSAWPSWRKAVTLPLDRGRQGDGKSMYEALDSARRIVQPHLLRRTKATKDPQTGELLLKLPPKHVHVVELELSRAERDFYDALYKKAKTKFDTFVASGEVLSKYIHILQLILKLRQALCHPFLVFAREGAADSDFASLERRCFNEMSGSSPEFLGNLLQELRQGELPDCPICFDTPEDPAMTPCGHIFCRDCAIKANQEWKGECPVCRRAGALSRRSLKVLPGVSRFPSRLLAKASTKDGSSSDGGATEGALSTKMKELLRLLREDMAAGRRAVVFSQWTSFLELVGGALENAGVPFKQFDGSLSREQRQTVIAWLGEGLENAGRVLLVSLKAGGVGLNLVVASRLYMLDQWWNPAVEEQAIQRVHRIGQTSEVHVFKFVVRDSIDVDLLETHKAKARLLEDAVEGGSSREATAKLSLDDLKRLFRPCRSSLRAIHGCDDASRASDDVAASMLQARPPPSSMEPHLDTAELASAAATNVARGVADVALHQAMPEHYSGREALAVGTVAGGTFATAPRSPAGDDIGESALVDEGVIENVPDWAAAEFGSNASPCSQPNGVDGSVDLSQALDDMIGAGVAELSGVAACAGIVDSAAPPPCRLGSSDAVEFSPKPVAPSCIDDDDDLSDEDLLAACHAYETQISGTQAAASILKDDNECTLPPALVAPADFSWIDEPPLASQPDPLPRGQYEVPQTVQKVPALSMFGGGGASLVPGAHGGHQDGITFVSSYGQDSTGLVGRCDNQPQATSKFAGANESAPPLCRCSTSQPAMLLTVRKEGPNMGRQFYKCELCGFFEWAASAGDDNGWDASCGVVGQRGLPLLGMGSNRPERMSAPPGGDDPVGSPLCRCTPPQPAALLTVRKEGPNTGRQFYKCGDCGFFEWASAAVASSASGGWDSGAGAAMQPAARLASRGFESVTGFGAGGGEMISGGDVCYKCGQAGHWAQDCPGGGGGHKGGGGAGQGASGKSGGSAGCFKCGQIGHWARDCVGGAAGSGSAFGGGFVGGGAGGSGRSDACFKCGRTGHWASSCPGR